MWGWLCRSPKCDAVAKLQFYSGKYKCLISDALYGLVIPVRRPGLWPASMAFGCVSLL